MHSYPKLLNVGHREVSDILQFPVVVQEKLDGSQFSFGITGDGWLWARSKGAAIELSEPQALFKPAVDWVTQHGGALTPGFIYRGEAISKPKHNTLQYGWAPECGFVLFDIERGEQDFLTPLELRNEAVRLVVPYASGVQYEPGEFTAAEAEDWLARTSMLGGTKVEGFVIKAYGQYTRFNTTKMAKHVSEAFKEVHQGDWKQRNPGRRDIVEQIINDFGGPARWQKAKQHLEERDELQGAPQDIGPLIKEAVTDLKAEEEDAIKAVLFAHFWPQISRGVTKGLPDWYKGGLLDVQFDC